MATIIRPNFKIGSEKKEEAPRIMTNGTTVYSISDEIEIFCTVSASASSSLPRRTGISLCPALKIPGPIRPAYISHNPKKPYIPYSSGTNIVATYIVTGSPKIAEIALTRLNFKEFLAIFMILIVIGYLKTK